MVVYCSIKHCHVAGLALLCWRWLWQLMLCSSVFSSFLQLSQLEMSMEGWLLWTLCKIVQNDTVTAACASDEFIQVLLWISLFFRYASPCLWNQLPVSLHFTPVSLRQPRCSLSRSDSSLSTPMISTYCVDSLLSLSITLSLFHSRIRTYL